MKPESSRQPERSSSEQLEVFAVAPPGLSQLVAAECMELGLNILEVSAAGVQIQTTFDGLFALNCWSRVASRVLVRLARFQARDFATLERRARKIAWSTVIASGTRVQFRVTCRKSRLYHSDAVAERLARSVLECVPDAIIDTTVHGEDEVRSDRDEGAQLMVVRFDHDTCTVSADSSGELLHRRGWRKAVAKAPLRENLAAAMLSALHWNGEVPLFDPFCGSGTIGIEAALRLRNIAPGLHRSFVMERWPGADAARFAAIREDADAKRVTAPRNVRIVLTDRDAGAIEAAKANAARAGVPDEIEIERLSLSDAAAAMSGEAGLILTNPPYGQRVSGGSDLRSLFSRLGTVVRTAGPQWRLGLLMPNERSLLGQLGMRMETVFQTSNGGLPVSLLVSPANTSTS